MLASLLLSQRSLKLSPFSKYFFFLVAVLIDFHCSLFTLLHHMIRHWFPPVYISFQCILQLWFFLVFSSFLLKFSLCSSVLSPSWVDIFLDHSFEPFIRLITRLCSIKVLPSSFIWNMLLCLLILTFSVCLCGIMQNSPLSWTWRYILVWEHYAGCMGPVALVGQMDLKCT